MGNILVRRQSSRKHVRLPELSDSPQTPPEPAAGSPRLSAPLAITRIDSRRALRLPWAEHTPPTPTPIPSAGYGRVGAFRSSFVRVHLSAPDPVGSFVPVTPGAGEPYAAYDTTAWLSQNKKWPEVAAQLQQSHLGVYEVTDPAYYAGWYPAGFAAQKAHKVWFERKHLTLQEPATSPQTDVSIAQPPAYFLPKHHNNWRDTRKVVKLPIPALAQFVQTTQSPAAYAPVKQHKRRDTARILRFPLQLDERPQTPPTPEQAPTAFLAPITNRRHGRSNIVLLPKFPDRQVEVFPSAIREAVNHVWYWDRYRKS